MTAPRRLRHIYKQSCRYPEACWQGFKHVPIRSSQETTDTVLQSLYPFHMCGRNTYPKKFQKLNVI